MDQKKNITVYLCSCFSERLFIADDTKNIIAETHLSRISIFFRCVPSQFQKSYGCKNVTTPSGPAIQTLLEVYFTEMIAALLKSYILIQLAYLTLASTVRCLYIWVLRRKKMDHTFRLREMFTSQTYLIPRNSSPVSAMLATCEHRSRRSLLPTRPMLRIYHGG